MESEKRILPIWKENGCIPVLDLRWDYRGWSDRSTRDARISTFADWLKNWEPIAMLVGDNLSLWIETGGSPTLEIVLCKGDARGLITIAGGRVLPKRAIEVLQRDPVALFQVLFGEVAGLSLLLHIGMWGFSGFRYDGAPVEDL